MDCKQCGHPVEKDRETWATPVCFACLPPPPPLPIHMERVTPLKIHKGLVLRVLREHPEALREVFPDRFETATEAIAALETANGEWFFDGVLTEAESVPQTPPPKAKDEVPKGHLEECYDCAERAAKGGTR
jgi:hypothetical protein